MAAAGSGGSALCFCLHQDVGVGLPAELRRDGGVSPDRGAERSRRRRGPVVLRQASRDLGAEHHGGRLSCQR